MSTDVEPTGFTLPELAADIAALQDEAERLWMALYELLDGAHSAAARLTVLAPDDEVDNGWKWASLARRSGVVGLRNTLVDFKERLDYSLGHIDSCVSNGWPFGPGQSTDRADQ